MKEKEYVGKPWERQRKWKENGKHFLIFIQGYLIQHYMARSIDEAAKRSDITLKEATSLARRFRWEERASEYDAALGLNKLGEFEKKKSESMESFLENLLTINNQILVASVRTLKLANDGLKRIEADGEQLTQENIPKYLNAAMRLAKESVGMYAEANGIYEILSHIEKITK